MQSLSRAIRRGNAHIIVPHNQAPEVVYKKGTEKKRWRYAEKEASERMEGICTNTK